MGFKNVFCVVTVVFTSAFVQAKDIVLAALEYPPHYGEQLNNHGPVVEIIVSAYAEQELNVEVMFLPWSRALIWADEGRVDGIVGAWYTKERAKTFLYSDPIYPNTMVFYKHEKANIEFTNYTDLKADGRVIGSVRGYTHVKGLEESGVAIHYVNNDVQNFKLLERERIDLVSVDRDYGKYVLALPELEQVKAKVEAIDKVLEVRQQFLVISNKAKQPEDKINAFNQGLAKLKAEGKIEGILQKHGIAR